MNPSRQSGSDSRASTISWTMASGTRSPLLRYSWALRPRSVPARTASRNMSPVEMCGSPWRVRKISAWVPFPAPGGPMKISRIEDPSLHEALVVPHQDVGLDLLHGLEGDPDDDEEGRPRQVEGQLAREPRQEDGPDGDEAEEQRPHQRQPLQDPCEVLAGRPPGPDPRDEPAVLLDVVGHVVGVKADGGVEVGEGDDEDKVQDPPEGRIEAQVGPEPLQPGQARKLGDRGRELHHGDGKDDGDHAGRGDPDG